TRTPAPPDPATPEVAVPVIAAPEAVTAAAAVSADVATTIPPAAIWSADEPMANRPSPGAWLLSIWGLGFFIALAPTLAGLARLALISRRARPMFGGRWALLIRSVMREL